MALLDLHTTNFHVVCGVLGTFMVLYSFVSFLVKERIYISEAFSCLLIGTAFSPHGADFVRPLQYAGGSEETLNAININFTRLVLCVQVFLAGWQLPAKYAKSNWVSLSLVLGPGMTVTWLISSLLVWALAEDASFLQALVVGACVAPTDPVLAQTIVKGTFADKHIPDSLGQLIAAESGANDGLGFPFIFLGLYLFRSSQSLDHSTAGAMGFWFGRTWAYEIILAVIWGIIIGYVARKILRLSDSLRWIDRESFHGFSIFMAVMIVGTCGLVGSDDVLCSFVAANTLSWDDWFRKETENDSFQPTIDMMLNKATFLWAGAVCPWRRFYDNDVISISHLVALGILIMLLRRLPVICILKPFVKELEQWKDAFFMGHFGPIGVSAIFYLYVGQEFLGKNITSVVDDRASEQLIDLLHIVPWFLVVTSIVVHGFSIPAINISIWFRHHLIPSTVVPPYEAYSLRKWITNERSKLHTHRWLRFIEDPLEELHQYDEQSKRRLKELGAPERPEQIPPRVQWRRLKVGRRPSQETMNSTREGSLDQLPTEQPHVRREN